MVIAIIIAIVLIVALFYPCFVVSGKCSEAEENRLLVRCINAENTQLLKLGQVYEVGELDNNHYLMLETPNYGCAFGKDRFEILKGEV